MKTKEQEEATELNDLNDVLAFVGPYWRAIAGVCILLVGGMIVFGLVSANRTKAREAAWTDFLSAAANRDPVELEQIASNSSGSVAPWAQQAAAQAKLIEASSAVHSDRGVAKRGFEEAVEGFNKAIEQSANYELILQRSILGLAQSHEGLNELGKAKEYYQQLVDKWPESSIAKKAQERVSSLDDPETIAFYKWFFDQTPVALLPASGEVPNLPFEIPDQPDVTVPNPTDSSASTEDADGSVSVATDPPPAEGDLNGDSEVKEEPAADTAE